MIPYSKPKRSELYTLQPIYGCTAPQDCYSSRTFTDLEGLDTLLDGQVLVVVYLCRIDTLFLLFFLVQCKVNGIDYKDGDTFYKPQNPVQKNNVGCQSCVCDRGATRCNHFYTCDFPLQCEKYIPAPQGLCCPTCGKATFNKASAPVVLALSTRSITKSPAIDWIAIWLFIEQIDSTLHWINQYTHIQYVPQK